MHYYERLLINILNLYQKIIVWQKSVARDCAVLVRYLC